jgi:hypothetical protein
LILKSRNEKIAKEWLGQNQIDERFTRYHVWGVLVGFWCENTCHMGSPDLPLELGTWHVYGTFLG